MIQCCAVVEVSGPTTHVYSVGVKGDKGEKGLRGLTGDQGDAGAKVRQLLLNQPHYVTLITMSRGNRCIHSSKTEVKVYQVYCISKIIDVVVCYCD